jgi:hypothetical protein
LTLGRLLPIFYVRRNTDFTRAGCNLSVVAVPFATADRPCAGRAEQ